MLESTATLMGLVHGLRAAGRVAGSSRGTNLLDTGCPYYDVYTCADGRWVAFGAIEERFFLNALDVLGLAADDPAGRELTRTGRAGRRLREALTAAFATRTRDEWAASFAGVDAA